MFQAPVLYLFHCPTFVAKLTLLLKYYNFQGKKFSTSIIFTSHFPCIHKSINRAIFGFSDYGNPIYSFNYKWEFLLSSAGLAFNNNGSRGTKEIELLPKFWNLRAIEIVKFTTFCFRYRTYYHASQILQFNCVIPPNPTFHMKNSLNFKENTTWQSNSTRGKKWV